MTKVEIKSRTPLPWNASWMTTTTVLMLSAAVVEMNDKNDTWKDNVWFGFLFLLSIFVMATAGVRWVEYADRIAAHRKARAELAKAVRREFPPRGM